MKKLYALLVAIDKYPIAGHQLNGCVADMHSFKNYLETNIDGKTFELHIKVLEDRMASRDNVIKAFDHFKQAKSEDSCIFFYAGHGSQMPAPEAFWHMEPDRMLETMVCWDSRVKNGRDLADKEISQLIYNATQANNPHFLAIMDCCHSGSGTRGTKENDMVAPRMAGASEDNPVFEGFYDIQNFDQFKGKNGALQYKPKIGQHVLLAAAKSSETAKEVRIDGDMRGAFTYSLIETLNQFGGKISYAELSQRINIKIKNKVNEQSSQVETHHSASSNDLFLNGAGKAVAANYLVYHDKKNGWMVNAGATYGIPAVDQQKPTTFELENGKEIKVLSILPSASTVSDPGSTDTDQIFKARLTNLSFEKIKIGFDVNLEKAAATAIQKDAAENPSNQFEITGETCAGQFLIQQNNNGLFLTRPNDDFPLFDPIKYSAANDLNTFFSRVESVSNWTQLLSLSNPKSSLQNDIEVSFFRATSTDHDNDECPAELVDVNQPITMEYLEEHGEFSKPAFRLKIKNKGNRALWVSTLFQSANFAITNKFMKKLELKPGEEAWCMDDGGGTFYKNIPVEVEDDYFNQGINEITEYLKMIISTDEIDTDKWNQEGLKIATRGAGRNGVAKHDWITKEIQMDIVRPTNAVKLVAGRDVEFMNCDIEVPEGFEADLAITSEERVTRSAGSMPVFPGDGINIQAFSFNEGNTRSTSNNIMELRNFKGGEKINSENPIRLKMKTALSDDEALVPFGYDANEGLWIPLGMSETDNTVLINQLPSESPSVERSLGKSLKIYLKKVVFTKVFGGGYDYPILALGEMDANGKQVLNPDPKVIKDKIEKGKNVLVIMHGIIGDNTDKLPILTKVKKVFNGKEVTLRELYDVVLTFDYESLNTPIAETAQNLADKLKAVGIVPGTDKNVHIIAHSMGGLVSRWYLEKLGGDKTVNHLIQCGTPNLGSPFASAYDMAVLLVGKVVNFIPRPPLVGQVMSFLNKARKQVEVTLKEMHHESEMIQALADSDGPKIPYTIIAGNTRLLKVDTALEEKLYKKIIQRFKHKTPYYQAIEKLLFHQSNDVAVAVNSIHGVQNLSATIPTNIEIPCDHMSYFVSEEGLNALSDVFFDLFKDEFEQKEEVSRILVTQEELERSLGDEKTAAAAYDKYCEFAFHQPFSGYYQLKENVILVDDEGKKLPSERGVPKFVVNLFNNVARKKRNKFYAQLIKDDPDKIRIVSEGDSWFQHPHWDVKDIIDQLSNQYAIYSIGAGGDTIRNMYHEAEYLECIKREKPQYFLLSGGGNDMLGDQFRFFLKDYTPGTPGKNPERFFNENLFDEIKNILSIYETMFQNLMLNYPDLKIITHGYDYLIPGSDIKKGWIGRYLIEKGITSPEDKTAIIGFLIDHFNEQLSALVSNYDNVIFVDLRGMTKPNQWYDEIHPNSQGFQDIAAKFQQAMFQQPGTA